MNLIKVVLLLLYASCSIISAETVTFTCTVSQVGPETCNFYNITTNPNDHVKFQKIENTDYYDDHPIKFIDSNISTFDYSMFNDDLSAVNLSASGVQYIRPLQGVNERYALINLNLSHNLIEKLPEHGFLIPGLSTIDLSFNKIREISKNIFKTIKNVNLSRNSLSNIEAGIFEGLLLDTLDCSYNSLVDIDHGSIQSLKLNLSHNLLTLTPGVLNATRFAKTLDLSYNKIKIISFKAFTNHTLLEYLNLEFNGIIRIDNFGLQVLHKATRLYDPFQGRYIQQVSVDRCELVLRNNNLTKITGKMFANTGDVTAIDLSFNNISEISGDAFQNSLKLKSLNFSNNNLNMIKSNSFSYLKFEWLYLDNNPLESIEQNALPDTLGKIDLNNATKLKFIGASSRRIYCSFSSIETIIIVAGTIEVNASNSHLKEIFLPENSTITIEKLDVSNNKLEDVSKIMKMKTLRYLDLSNNPIKKFEKGAFKELVALEHLKMAKTNLKRIDFVFLSQQTELRTFDLSGNGIIRINLDHLLSCPLLTELILDGNNLENIDYNNIKNYFSQLEYIGLYSNNWGCILLTQIIKSLKYQKISVFSTGQNIHKATDGDNIGGIACKFEATAETTSTTPSTTVRVRTTEIMTDGTSAPEGETIGTEFQDVEITTEIQKLNQINLNEPDNLLDAIYTTLDLFTFIMTVIILITIVIFSTFILRNLKMEKLQTYTTLY